MHRFRKLLWMIFIFGIVFFIICDEKWYKIKFENNHIVFDEIRKKSDSVVDKKSKNEVYKNSNLIYLNYEFENPRSLRKSDGMDPEYLAKLEEEKKLEQKRLKNQEKIYTWSNIIALKNEDSISSVFQWIEKTQKTWTTKQEVKQNINTEKSEVNQNTWIIKQEVKQNTWTTKTENTWKVENFVTKTWITEKVETPKSVVYYPVRKYEHNKFTLNLNKWIGIQTVKIEKYPWKESLSLNIYNGKNSEPKVLYKNSNKIKLYSWFENPRNMRSSVWIDEDFLTKQENKPVIIWLNNSDTISSAWQDDWKNTDNVQDVSNDLYQENQDVDKSLEENINSINVENWIDYVDNNKNEAIWNEENDIESQTHEDTSSDSNFLENEWWNEAWEEIWEGINLWEEIQSKQEAEYKVEKYEHSNHSINMSKWISSQKNLVTVDKPEISNHSINMSEWKIPEVVLVKIDRYQLSKHDINLRKWVKFEHSFVVEDTQEAQQSEDFISDSLLESLLEDEEINIDTLESENDEFLQKVFEKTKDRDVMNLIVETYLNEYQFVKAKRFIENLPDMYRDELKPSLDLRVAFNSFALSSKTIGDNLNSLLQKYISKNEISTEDKNRYLWIIALVDRNYDKFFEISEAFTSEKNKAFASKLQWYKEQISKQMWMPDYYFDTLVSLELFNQWLFQPAKVLALYSLQKNPNYILPHQVLAYANFLTNSWDTSVEYLKKLVDLDPNNTEKYRFLMWVASYRDEKYEQSVVMLSMIKDEDLRLDTQRYLINNYLKLGQKNKLISTWNKLLGSENLVASDFYTYFYETFFHPYSEWEDFQLYAFDTELANKMLRVCSITLQDEEKAVCTYWTIGRNIAMWQFDGLEQYLLNLTAEYPQWYLYQALWDYYIQKWDLEKAKAYLIKAISLVQKKSERSQIKKLLQDTM